MPTFPSTSVSSRPPAERRRFLLDFSRVRAVEQCEQSQSALPMQTRRAKRLRAMGWPFPTQEANARASGQPGQGTWRRAARRATLQQHIDCAGRVTRAVTAEARRTHDAGARGGGERADERKLLGPCVVLRDGDRVGDIEHLRVNGLRTGWY